MDLCIELEDFKLNIRAGAIIVHDNKLLTHKDTRKNNHYCIPGGRIELGENSEETIKREIREEMQKEIEIKKYSGIIENFFILNEKKYHELFFIYNAEFTNEQDKKINTTMSNQEGKDYLVYEWIDIDKIEEYNVLPKCIKTILKEKREKVHIINDDINQKYIVE